MTMQSYCYSFLGAGTNMAAMCHAKSNVYIFLKDFFLPFTAIIHVKHNIFTLIMYQKSDFQHYF